MLAAMLDPRNRVINRRYGSFWGTLGELRSRRCCQELPVLSPIIEHYRDNCRWGSRSPGAKRTEGLNVADGDKRGPGCNTRADPKQEEV